MIKIRQHPFVAGLLLLVGAGVGSAWFIRPEVIFLIIGGINVLLSLVMMFSPIVEIDKDELRVKNMMGVIRKRIPHGGLPNIRVVGDQIRIEKGDMFAVVDGINRKWLHRGDWEMMQEAVERAREHAGKPV